MVMQFVFGGTGWEGGGGGLKKVYIVKFKNVK